jgi:hypothetical protein
MRVEILAPEARFRDGGNHAVLSMVKLATPGLPVRFSLINFLSFFNEPESPPPLRPDLSKPKSAELDHESSQERGSRRSSAAISADERKSG